MASRTWSVSLFFPVLAVASSSQSGNSGWRIEGDRAGGRFGSALATADVNGDGFGDLVVGAPGHTDLFSGEGRVSAYLGSAGGLAVTPAWTVYGRQKGAHLGSSVVAAGDVNGDGFQDVLVAAPDVDRQLPTNPVFVGPLQKHVTNECNEGAVYLFQGSASGLGALPSRIVLGIEPGEHFGAAVAGAGDVNGDGYDDVLVGATGKAGGLGGVFLFAGKATGLSAFPGWMRVGTRANAGYGSALGGASDLDKDGFADFVVSTPSLGASCGETELFRGSATGPGAVPDQVYSGLGMSRVGPSVNLNVTGPLETLYVDEHCAPESAGWRQLLSTQSGTFPALEGACAVAVGDLDGDGRSEAIVGNPGFEYGPYRGRAWVYTNVPGHIFDPFTPFPTYDGEQAGAGWGEALAAIDVDGDGADELFIGAPLQDEGAIDEGVVEVVPGRKARLDFTLVRSFQSMRGKGASGDFDADGYDDLVLFQGTYYVAGHVELRYGSPAGLAQLADAVLSQPSGSGYPKVYSDPVAGDFDGDGYDDVLISFYPEFPYGRTPQGEQWLFLGGPGGLDSAPIVVTAQPGWSFSVGDVNGDGRDDALIARDASIDLHLGTAGGLASSPAQTFAPDDAYFGFSIHAGNLNGDAFADVVIVRSSGTQLALMTGSPAGLVLQQVQSFPAETRFDALIDFDHDGLDDLLLGHLAAPGSYINSWQYRVHRGTSGGFVHAVQCWEDPLPLTDYPDPVLSNIRVFSAFDADQDGYVDLVLTGNRLQRGSPSGMERMPSWSSGTSTIPGMNYQKGLVPIRGDFDGNGRLEVLSYEEQSSFVMRIHEVTPL